MCSSLSGLLEARRRIACIVRQSLEACLSRPQNPHDTEPSPALPSLIEAASACAGAPCEGAGVEAAAVWAPGCILTHSGKSQSDSSKAS